METKEVTEIEGYAYMCVGDAVIRLKNIGYFVLDGKNYHISDWNPDKTYQLEVKLTVKK